MKKKFTLLIAAILLFAGGGKVWGQAVGPYQPDYNGTAGQAPGNTNNIYIYGTTGSYSHDPYGGATGCHDSGSRWYPSVSTNNHYLWINSASVHVNVNSGSYNRFMFGNMSLATIQQNRTSGTHNHACSGNCGPGASWCLSCCSCGPYTFYTWPSTGLLIAQNTTRPATIEILAGARVQLTNTSSSIDRDQDAPAIYAYTAAGGQGSALTHTGTTTILFPTGANQFTLRMDGTFQAGQDGVIILGGSAGTLHNGDTLGVNGDYNHAMAWTTQGNETGTFQIGGSTNNTSKFTINSNGTLMNYGVNNVNIGTGTKLPVLVVSGNGAGGVATCNNLTNALKIKNTSQSIVYSILAPQVAWTGNGPLLMSAAGSVNYGAAATFAPSQNNYIQVNAGTNIATTGAFAYTGGASNYQFTAGNNFTVSGTTTITTNDDCGEDLIRAQKSILLNDNVLVAKNKKGANTMRAIDDHFTVADAKTYTFNQNETAAGNGDVLVYAGQNVTMGGVVAVTRAGSTSGNIDWTAGTTIWTKANVTFTNNTASGATRWTAGSNIRTDKDVTFSHSGAGFTTWSAGQDILTNDDIQFTNSGTGKTTWWAQKNILTTGGTNARQIDFNITGDAATEWRAVDNNITTTHQDILFTLGASVTKLTNWYAGQNITSTDCTDKIDFIHTGTGDVNWRANTGSISMQPEITFTKNNANNGYTEWWAAQHITTSNNVMFTSSGNTNTLTSNGTKWNAGQNINVNQTCGVGKVIAFTNHSTHDDFMWWNAGQNIKVDGTNAANKITVNFLNKATNQDNATTNYMRWDAVANDIDIDYATINFTTDAGAKGYTEWKAGQNILMDQSKVDFVNKGVGLNDNTKWHAVGADINAGNTPITFDNTGTGWTYWLAGNDIRLHDQSPVKITDAATTNWLKLEATRDFSTGINSPLVIDHSSPNPIPGLAADITITANTGNIWTESSADIINDGIQNQTYLYAGKDIRIDSTLTFKATNAAGIDWVRMRANAGDIIINTRNADLTGHDRTSGFNANDVCDVRRAAVNFTLTGAGATSPKGAGSTMWWAKQNIISNDTIHFHYDNTGNKVQDLWMHADVENIDLRRILKIDFDSDSLIRLEALTNRNTANRANRHSLNTAGCFNGTQHVNIGQYGNIRTSDSVIINRTYAGAIQGLTELDAYNDIQTAMFNFTSANTKGDNTNVTSRMGDIWLGYSWQNPAHCTTNNIDSPVGFDLNRFVYRVPATAGGKLNIKAGYDDKNTDKYGGGNIYFTHIVDSLGKGGTYDTEISIPYSNMFICSGTDQLFGCDYERAGIIGGVARCQSKIVTPATHTCTDTGLIHVGNKGNLLVDAGTRGNIIINNGAFLNFQEGTGSAKFLTRYGDIDMRDPFDVDSMQGSLLFYANSELQNKLKVGVCGCDERRNNVYLQDFRYIGHATSGSIFIGADNNIKLQYGGLKNIGTMRDPFMSDNKGYPCGGKFHCDADTLENQARHLILNFAVDTTNQPITSGGFAAVASDLIDVYRNMIYTGGQGSGMSAVPGYGTLHGEAVAGYGLFIKTQANKDNWNKSDFDVNSNQNREIGAACDDDQCNGFSYLHQVARVTFHSDARIYTENQRSLITSPVLETYGFLDLNTHNNKGGKTSIAIHTDSLIMHDSLIIDGKHTQFTSWSPLRRSMPIFKFGHQRMTPPAKEDGGYCAECYVHTKDKGKIVDRTALDTIFVTFRNDASVPRLHTLVADHAVLSFLTDSFDNVKGNPTLNAKFYTDTFKIRNHVELFHTKDHTHDGHFELISEEQMQSKNYAGVYSRHLHLEPVAPTCANFGYSQLWLQDPALDVITTSTFGGFGWIHADVHVEIEANLFPGYASLRHDGNCYEQKAGILRMQDLRIDKGANLSFSIGDNVSPFVETYGCSPETRYELGGSADCLDVDSLTIFGEIDLDILVRPEGLDLGVGESRCFPIIRYQFVGKENLNNLRLKKDKLTSKDHKTIDGIYYLALDFDTVCNVVSICVSTMPNMTFNRLVRIPSVAGVTTNPIAGDHHIGSGKDFTFKATYANGNPLAVKTNRTINGVTEEIVGVKNANGEYEYVIQRVQQDIYLAIGPEYAAAASIDGVAVWSHDNVLYIRVDREDIASVYSVAGQLVKLVELPEGDTSFEMQRGVYLVTLKDGSVHKVIVK